MTKSTFSWLAERKDVLSAFFWMLTMAAYVRYAEAPRFRRYVPILLFFIMGLTDVHGLAGHISTLLVMTRPPILKRPA